MGLALATFWNNDVEDWIIAAGIAAGLIVGLLTARSLLLRLLARVRPDETGPWELARLLVGGLHPATLTLVGLYAGSLVLNLPADADDVTEAIAVFAILFQLGRWGMVALRFWTQRLEARDESRTTAGAMVLVRFAGGIAIWTLLVLVGFENVGIDVTALLLGLGIGGIAVALAAQPILADLFASLAILLDRPFLEGDFIAVGAESGTVKRVGIKTTRLASLSGEEIVIANSDLVNSRLHNYKIMEERRGVFQLGVTYDTPRQALARIPELVREVVEGQEAARLDRVHFKEFGDSALVFETVYFVAPPDYALFMDTQQAINLALYERFAAEGIEFAYPTQVVHVQREEPAPAAATA